jgi:hypothetical protein
VTRAKTTSEPWPDGWHDLASGSVLVRDGVPVELCGVSVLTVPEAAAVTGASPSTVRRFAVAVAATDPHVVTQDAGGTWLIKPADFDLWSYRYAASARQGACRIGRMRTGEDIRLLRSGLDDVEVARRIGRTPRAVYHARRRLDATPASSSPAPRGRRRGGG